MFRTRCFMKYFEHLRPALHLVLVSTPEKWDAVTRRNTGEASLFQALALLIIDEVHLLQCDRGPVLEAIIARMFRLRGAAGNKRLRVIGLSATLPNYEEIAQLLRVKLDVGLFYFNWGFRPVPLKLNFVGSKNCRSRKRWDIEDDVCYCKVLDYVKSGHQVLIFVHSRAMTISLAFKIEKKADELGDTSYFIPAMNRKYQEASEILKDSRMKKLKRMFKAGLAFHNAGMLREDRLRAEKLFAGGYVKVLVSTATLAWGVNLPAHAVVIKGTRIYSAKKGTHTNIDLLDVQQMFGRAGRPQFDDLGEATLICNQIDLPYYLSLLAWQLPIQSQMINALADHLNAEIVLGNVRNMNDALDWFKYTFCYIRMCNQPSEYGCTGMTVENKCIHLLTAAAQKLHIAEMIVFDMKSQNLDSTDLGRIASHLYMCNETVTVVNKYLETDMDIFDLIILLTKAKEFEQVKMRPDETREIEKLRKDYCLDKTSRANRLLEGARKIDTLIQTQLSSGEISNSGLHLDQVFVVENSKRILGAIFDIAVVRRMPKIAHLILTLMRCLEHRCRPDQHPIFQMKYLDQRFKYIIDEKGYDLRFLRAMKLGQLNNIVRDQKWAERIYAWLHCLPIMKMDVCYYRLLPTIVRVQLTVRARFKWSTRLAKEGVEPFTMYVVNYDTGEMYTPQNFNIYRNQVERGDTITIEMNIALNENVTLRRNPVLFVDSLHWNGINNTFELQKEKLNDKSGAIHQYVSEDPDEVICLLDELKIENENEVPEDWEREFEASTTNEID